MNKEYLVSAKQMKLYDDNTIEKIGMSSAVLMERAAYCVAMEVCTYLGVAADAFSANRKKVIVFSGNGNNGADGVAVGRILKEYGLEVTICLVSQRTSLTEELQKQLSIVSYYDIGISRQIPASLQEFDLVVDALFGNGLNRKITGYAKEAIECMNRSGIPIVSVDIPSGIDATSGEVLGSAVSADVTVTFGFYKIGQFRYPGRQYCGRLVKAKIGINETGFFGKKPNWFTLMPPRDGYLVQTNRSPMGNKGTFGKVFVAAGRESAMGAALLCASSAFRSGCGMVCVFTQKENKDTFLQILPEAMIETYTPEDKEETRLKLQKWLEWADVAVMGCGLSQDDTAYGIVKEILEHTSLPVVCDADALQLIARNRYLGDCIRKRSELKQGRVVFTPHPKELASLAGCSITEVKNERMPVIDRVLEEYPVILVAKDADTLVCARETDTYLNSTGNDGLSTAGSGDVLAGLTASMLAQSIRREGKEKEDPIFEAVCRSVYIHGLTADYLAKENGKSFLVASDLIEAYKYILR